MARVSKLKLLEQLTAFNSGDIRLRQRVVEVCQGLKLRSPYDPGAIIIPELFQNCDKDPAFIAWTQPDVLDWFTEALPPPPPTAVWSKPGSLDFQNASIGLLSGVLIAGSTPDMPLYIVADPYHREVERLPNDPATRVRRIKKLIAPTLNGQGIACNETLTRQILDHFDGMAQAHDVRVLGQLHEPLVYCLQRAKVEPDASVPFPLLRSFTARLNDPEAFGAYIAGIYFGLNTRGRQILYISDEGESGKSSTMRMFKEHLFGNVGCGLSANVLKESKHATAMFVDKKFVVAGDNNNPAIILSSMLKELTGDDETQVDPKYKDTFSTFFECRFVINANVAPMIIGDRHNRSRTLWLKLEKLPDDLAIDGDYDVKCAAELPGFLAWGLDCYRQRCPDNYAIQVNAAVREATELRIAETEEKFAIPFLDLFVIDKAGKMTGGDFLKATKDLRMNEHELRRFRDWITSNFKANVTVKHVGRGVQFTGLRLKAARDRHGGNDDTVVPS